MNQIVRTPLLRAVAGCALLLVTSLAQAQYAWIDEKGIRQYSDRPPPPSTPAGKILKAPGRPQLELAAPVQEGAAGAIPAGEAQAQKAKAPPTLAEREADYRKRAKDRAEAERKATEEAQRKTEVAENCASARQAKAQLDSGMRIADTGADGERAYISDAERAKRAAKASKVLEGCR
jgi:hypothetical protein